MAISDMRRQYSKGRLSESDITSSPFIMFDKWLKDAIDAGIPDPTAMTVATVPGFLWSVRFAYVAALKSFLFLRMLLISFRDRKTVS